MKFLEKKFVTITTLELVFLSYHSHFFLVIKFGFHFLISLQGNLSTKIFISIFSFKIVYYVINTFKIL